MQGKDINRRSVFSADEVGLRRESIAAICEAFLLWCKSQVQGHGTFWNKSWSAKLCIPVTKARHSTSKESWKKTIRAIQKKKTSYREGRCEDWGSSFSRGRDHIWSWRLLMQLKWACRWLTYHSFVCIYFLRQHLTRNNNVSNDVDEKKYTLTSETFNLNFSKLVFFVKRELPQPLFARGFELLTSFLSADVPYIYICRMSDLLCGQPKLVMNGTKLHLNFKFLGCHGNIIDIFFELQITRPTFWK